MCTWNFAFRASVLSAALCALAGSAAMAESPLAAINRARHDLGLPALMDASANDLPGALNACNYNLHVLKKECDDGEPASCNIGSQMLPICNQVAKRMGAASPPVVAGPVPDAAMNQATQEQQNTFNMVAGIVGSVNKMHQDAANQADAGVAELERRKASGNWPADGVERARAELELARARCSAAIAHASGGIAAITAPECRAADAMEAQLCEHGDQRTCGEAQEKARRAAIVGQMAEAQARASALESHITSGIRETHQRQMDRDDFFHARDEFRDAGSRLERDLNSGDMAAADRDIEAAKNAARTEEDAARRLGWRGP